MYELAGSELKLQKEVEKKTSFKCGTFGASGLAERQLATGNFEGYLQLWDLEHTDKAIMDVKAHTSIVNAIDGCGGQAKGYGAPELVTSGEGKPCARCLFFYFFPLFFGFRFLVIWLFGYFFSVFLHQ